jgi:hypothetical protein
MASHLKFDQSARTLGEAQALLTRASKAKFGDGLSRRNDALGTWLGNLHPCRGLSRMDEGP